MEIGIRYPGLTEAIVLGATTYKLSETSINTFKALGFEKPGVVNIERMQRDSPDLITLLKTEHVRADDPDYWKTLLKQYSNLWWAPLDYAANDFRRIALPAIILQNDRDEFVELEQAIEMYRFIPNGELAILPNSRHSSPNAKLLMDTVLDFLLRHTASE